MRETFLLQFLLFFSSVSVAFCNFGAGPNGDLLVTPGSSGQVQTAASDVFVLGNSLMAQLTSLTSQTLAAQLGFLSVDGAMDDKRYQTLPSVGAKQLEFFTIGSESYVVVANSGSTLSEVYHWETATSTFQFLQNLTTPGSAECWKYFSVGGTSYLAFGGASASTFQWSTLTNTFGLGTAWVLPAAFSNVRDWDFLDDGTEQWLAIANFGSGTTDQSYLYKWTGSAWVNAFHWTTHGAYDIEFFYIEGVKYMAVSNSQTSSTTKDVYVEIWKHTGSTPTTVTLTSVQTLSSRGAFSSRHFSLGGNDYLAVAENGDAASTSVDSTIYIFSSVSNLFINFQFVSTYAIYDWAFFSLADGTGNSQSYLISATNDPSQTSALYKWTGTFFALSTTVTTQQATNWISFSLNSINYLAVANAGPGISSMLYKVVVV